MDYTLTALGHSVNAPDGSFIVARVNSHGTWTVIEDGFFYDAGVYMDFQRRLQARVLGEELT